MYQDLQDRRHGRDEVEERPRAAVVERGPLRVHVQRARVPPQVARAKIQPEVGDEEAVADVVHEPDERRARRVKVEAEAQRLDDGDVDEEHGRRDVPAHAEVVVGTEHEPGPPVRVDPGDAVVVPRVVRKVFLEVRGPRDLAQQRVAALDEGDELHLVHGAVAVLVHGGEEGLGLLEGQPVLGPVW